MAEALGLRLKNPDDVEIDGKKKPEMKSERDLHGRYERAPDRPIVSAISPETRRKFPARVPVAVICLADLKAKPDAIHANTRPINDW